jgi:pyruvate dehydrogenase E1 component alpha subunit
MMTKEELIQFEEEIKAIYLQGKIRAPVHFSRGNEEPLIRIFTNIRKEDWVFSTHRSHSAALLKGIPREWVKAEILASRSIHLNNAEYNFFTSAIVGGCLPIALGVAMAIKHYKQDRHVFVFIGDMTAETGIFHECQKYAIRNKLPVTFVIEDNGLSVNTPTQESWGLEDVHLENPKWNKTPVFFNDKEKTIKYKYERQMPHIGCGQWVTFHDLPEKKP